ncbi:matrix-remodeling-associated protein 7 isoform 2-T2 [Clarias gariepinus]
MDAWVDMWVILLSLLFTVLAGFLTAHLFARNKTVPGKTDSNPASFTEQSSKEALSGLGEPQTESEHTPQTIEELPDKQWAANQQEVAGDWCEKGKSEHDFSSSHCPSVNRMYDADQALKYMPGVLRTSQLEKMMSKEELEEEQSKLPSMLKVAGWEYLNK